MGIIKRLFSAPGANRAYNDALDIYRSLRQYPVFSPQYRQALLKIASLLQEGIKMNERHGDAHVLLANTFYLLHIDINPEPTISLPLKLAASVIQHWNDEPMRQYPWTKNIDNGQKIYDMVSSAIVLANPNLKYHIEQEMKKLKLRLYTTALVWKNIKGVDSITPSDIRENKATENDIRTIWDKWTNLNVSPETQDKCRKAVEPLEEYFSKLFVFEMNMGVLKRSKADKYGEELGALTGLISRASFMVGLEYASTNDRSKVPDFLIIFCSDSTRQFLSRLVGSSVEKGIISEADLGEIREEVGEVLLQLTTDCYKIGIEYFDKRIR